MRDQLGQAILARVEIRDQPGAAIPQRAQVEHGFGKVNLIQHDR
jgi:hypothetical protein